MLNVMRTVAYESSSSTRDFVYSLCKSFHVAGGDTSNRDSTVFRSVDRVLNGSELGASMRIGPFTSLANWSICSGLSPVYANIPI